VSAPHPPDDLESALTRAADARAPSSEGVAGAIAAYADAAPAAPAGRLYRVHEVIRLMVVFAASLLIFDSEGLLTWAQRMDVGPAQSFWLATLGAMHGGMEQLKLTSPRRWINAAGDRLGQALGSVEDPLAEGWTSIEPSPEPEPVVEAVREQPGVPEAALAVPAVADPHRGTAVLLIGDSLIAGSLGGTLSRALSRDARLHVIEAFQTATGLSRPEIYDWMKVVPPLIEREKPQLVVVSFGANDATNIREGDRLIEFGDFSWRRSYSEHVLAMMRALSGTDARVLWLGLPPMRDTRLHERTQYLNGIFAQCASKVPRVEFLPLGMLVSSGSGEYATFLNGPDGRLVRYRLDDGVHYSPAGARAISRWVVDWIYERMRKLPPP
jgi:hypothetical protein